MNENRKAGYEIYPTPLMRTFGILLSGVYSAHSEYIAVLEYVKDCTENKRITDIGFKEE